MFVIDSGTAATGISDLRPDVRAVLAEHPDQVGQLSVIAYIGNAHPTILIIGPGVGDHVLEGLKAHASSIASSTQVPVTSQKRRSRR